MKEMEFTRRICKELEADGALVFPIVAGNMQKPGWPDRLIVHRFGLFMIEFKGSTTPLSLAQKSVHSAIALRGPYVFVARAPGLLYVCERDGYCNLGTFTTGSELAQLVKSTLERT